MAAQGPAATANLDFGPFFEESSDDLPRTIRREKEARAKEARERAAQERAAAPSLSAGSDSYSASRPGAYPAGGEPRDGDIYVPAIVRRFDVSFAHLAKFFLKAVLASIPAMILLTTILWFAGALVQSLFPALIKMRILIGFPG
jgi:hypothetical protein